MSIAHNPFSPWIQRCFLALDSLKDCAKKLAIAHNPFPHGFRAVFCLKNRPDAKCRSPTTHFPIWIQSCFLALDSLKDCAKKLAKFCCVLDLKNRHNPFPHMDSARFSALDSPKD
jgi:hypothetical protein